jgi:hypothetical protein
MHHYLKPVAKINDFLIKSVQKDKVLGYCDILPAESLLDSTRQALISHRVTNLVNSTSGVGLYIEKFTVN